MPGWVELPIPRAQYDEVAVWVNDRPVVPVIRALGQGPARVLLEWPRSGPGHYCIAVRWPEGSAQQVWTVKPAKISQPALEQLLADLEEELPSSIALGIKRCGGLGELQVLPPHENTYQQECERLRRAILGTRNRPGLKDVLPRLQLDPQRTLIARSVWVPRRQARRLEPAGLRQCLLRAGNLDDKLTPLQVLDPRVEQTFDVYENRLVKAFVHQVGMRLRWASQFCRNNPELTQLRSVLRSAETQAPFLKEVKLLEALSPRLTMVLLKRPQYRAALEGYLEFQRTLRIRLEEPQLDAPLANLPFLYELWGSLQVHAAVLAVGAEMGFEVTQNRLVHRDGVSAFVRVVAANVASLELQRQGVRLSLIPQRSYRPNSFPLYSASFEQVPDLALEISSPDKPVRVLVFDPKYKLDGERPVKADIDKMHAYRDAIRDPENRRVVGTAAILYPGDDVRYAGDDVMAIQAYPGKGYLRAGLERLVRAAIAATERPSVGCRVSRHG